MSRSVPRADRDGAACASLKMDGVPRMPGPFDVVFNRSFIHESDRGAPRQRLRTRQSCSSRGAGSYTSKSPGWQRNSRHNSSKSENRMLFERLQRKWERFTAERPTWWRRARRLRTPCSTPGPRRTAWRCGWTARWTRRRPWARPPSGSRRPSTPRPWPRPGSPPVLALP